ncbi:MAG TPA: SMP-30/gluconolactonase/LRE family protein [Steroidobacteraceae bacterium]|nr:SMP-30/gluconolactonase/LRE family protein [Steroidobacteraceae bacterium]
MTACECVGEYAAITGESPLWSRQEQALYWIDIHEPALHRFDPASNADRRWRLPDEIGCFALDAEGSRAILGLRCGVCELRLDTGELRQLAPAPFDPALFRFNEGACDSTGRFWLGTMFDPRDPRRKRQRLKGEWHSYSETEGLVAHGERALIPNGLAWDEGYSTIYFADSEAGVIRCAHFDSREGTISEARVFASIPKQLGVPDGCAIDARGGYWSAIHGGGRLRRFRSDGSFDRDLLLPVSQPTMCAFGGANLEALYVTSETRGLSASERPRQPLAGKLLRLTPGVRGLPRALFSAAVAS